MNQSFKLLSDLQDNITLVYQTLIQRNRTIKSLNMQVDMLTESVSVANAEIQSLQKYIAQHKIEVHFQYDF